MQSAGTGTGSHETTSRWCAMSAAPGALRSLSMLEHLREVVGDDPGVVRERRLEEEQHLPARRRAASRRGPRRDRVQWCIVSTAIAASNVAVANGSASATPRTAGAAPGGRCAIIVARRLDRHDAPVRGSYEPVPAPTFSTVRASPSAAWIGRGDARVGRRVACVGRADAVVFRASRFTAAIGAAPPSRSPSPRLPRPCGLPFHRGDRTPAHGCRR